LKIAEYLNYLQKYFTNRSDVLEFASHTSGIPYSQIPMHLSDNILITDETKSKLDRVKSGEPLAYVINNKNFYGFDIYVDESVLIPRPETELLVEKALETAAGRKNLRILDICTGSGCVLTALLSKLENAEGVGLDISSDALETALKNLKRYDLKAELLCADALRIDELDLSNFDIITCNPPYLTEQEWSDSPNSLKYEPKNALSAGVDGLLFYKKLMDMIPNICNKNSGSAHFELGLGQYELLKNEGYCEDYSVTKDFQGIKRVISWINL